MFTSRGSQWGPSALPSFLRAQLAAHGFAPEDAGRCARLINENPAGAATASLFVDLGSCKFLEADIDGAIASWRHAIGSRHDAAAARAMLNLGLLFEHLHLHEQAVGLLARVAERNVAPYVMAAAMASARCQVAMGDPARAMETMARLTQRSMAQRPAGPGLIEALYGLGEVAEHAGRLDRAERAWRVAAASPTSALQQDAAARLAQLLAHQGHGHAVVDAVRSSGMADAGTSSALLDSADLLLRAGEKTAAAKLLAEVAGADLATDERFRLVDANVTAGRVNEAIDELEALLADTDKHAQYRALVSLGHVYASYDMTEPAISMFQRAVASDDPYWMPAASLALGDLLAARGDRSPANEYWSYAAECAVPRLAELAQLRMAESETQLDDVSPQAADHTSAPESASDPDAEIVPIVLSGNPDVVDEPTANDGSMPAPVDGGAESGADVSVELGEAHLVSLDETDVDHLPLSNAAPSPIHQSDDQAEPMLLVLADIEDGPIEPPGAGSAESAASLAAPESLGGEPLEPERPKPSAFARYVEADMPNPYAALAPDGHNSDIPPTARNPYAELAPNFDEGEFEPPPDVEPGDWESMLDDWPRDDGVSKPKKRSSAFSRYT